MPMPSEHRCPACGRVGIPQGLRVDLSANELWLDGRPFKLRPTAAEVAAAIVEAFPRPVSMDRLIRRVYGMAEVASPEKAVSVHMHHLRASIRGSGWEVVNAGGWPGAWTLRPAPSHASVLAQVTVPPSRYQR